MTPAATPDGAPSHIHVPSLAIAVAIMLACTLYPPMLTDTAGKAEHGLATALFLAMSAGLVRGVGFIPHVTIWRWLPILARDGFSASVPMPGRSKLWYPID